MGNSSVGHWGGEVLGEVLAKVSGLPTLGGSKWRAGSRRYLVERVTRIVPGTVFCTPNFRRLLQRKCPNQVLGPKVLQCLVCRLQGEYVSNLLIAWFCTGCGSGMGLRLLPRIMETSAESRLKFNPQWRVGSKLEEARCVIISEVTLFGVGYCVGWSEVGVRLEQSN